jgi:hypothetical protein
MVGGEATQREVEASQALDFVHFWRRALELQNERAPSHLGDAEMAEIEIRFFLEALRQWYRALTWYAKHDGLAQSLASKFIASWGQVVTMRNALEHFDRFTLGTSHAHASGQVEGKSTWFSQSGRTIIVSVGDLDGLDLLAVCEAVCKATDHLPMARPLT